MSLLLRILLLLCYPLCLAARCLNGILGRDPLRLRDPGGESYWIERQAEPDSQSYFSEASVAEGKGHGGMGALARIPLRFVARLYAPPSADGASKFAGPAADREEGIPDEVYTLW